MLQPASLRMRQRHRLWAAFLLPTLFFACASRPTPTQIEVQVASQYAPEEIGAIDAEVSWPGTPTKARLRCRGAHPFSFRVNGVAGRPEVPAHVVVRSYDPAGNHLVDSIAEVAFVAGEVRVLPIQLARSCASAQCD